MRVRLASLELGERIPGREQLILGDVQRFELGDAPLPGVRRS
jgi:hypothetical protein